VTVAIIATGTVYELLFAAGLWAKADLTTPSWVPHWRVTAFGMYRAWEHSAAGTTPCACQIRHAVEARPILWTQGYVVDEVVEVVSQDMWES
jgi:hypothetical protein